MPSTFHKTYPIFAFEGGVNTRFAKTVLAENEADTITNGHLQARGGIEKRSGFVPYITGDTATTYAIVGLTQFHRIGTDYIIRVQNGAVQYDLSGTWTAITGSLTISTTHTDRWTFANFRDNVIGTNGVNTPWKWPGTGNAVVITRAIAAGADTIDKAATLVRHRERIILGDVTATESAVATRYESVIWPSDAGTLDTWSASPTGKIHIDRGDGDSITGLHDVLGYLVVFKQHSLHRVNNLGGDAGTQDRKRVAPVGCPGPHAAVVVDTFVYFLDVTGRFWRYDVRGDNEDALTELTAQKLGTTTLTGFVEARLPYAHLIHEPTRNEIWAFLSEGTSATTDCAWVYNIDTGGFTRFEWTLDWNVSCRAIDANDAEQVYAGSHTGLVAKLNSGVTDNGTAVTLTILTRHFNAGEIALVKGYRDVDLYTVTTGDTQTIDLEHRLDFATSGTSVSVDLGGGGGDTLG